MAIHLLLTAAARTLSIKAIYAAGEEGAYASFRKFRWPQTDGAPVCPQCGSVDCYTLSTRRQFTCSDCRHRFSVTSGTIFHGRKLKFVDLMAAICIIVNGAKGISALQLCRDLDVQHKTAFVLAHKLREAIAVETKGAILEGEVEVDGAYFGGHIRPENKKEDRKDRRLAEHQTGKSTQGPYRYACRAQRRRRR
jgi:transposase-like protein